MWFRSNSNRPRYNLLGTGGFLTASNQVKQTKRPARHNSRYGRLLSMQPLEPRRLLAVIAAEINLFEDNNGSPGALIANDTVDVGDTFFAEIAVQPIQEQGDTEDPGGVFSMQVNVGWDPNVLEEIDNPFPNLHTVPLGFSFFFGTPDNAAGQIEALSGGTTQLHFAVGENAPERFFRLHFRADAPAVDSMITLNGSGGITDLSNPNAFVELLQPESVTVIADDTAAVVNINDPTLTEGTNGTTNLSFDVSLTDALPSIVDVDFAVAGGSADQGSDFTVTSTSPVNFQPGETSKTIEMVVVADSTVERDETIVVDLTNIVVTNDSAGIAGPDAVLGDGSGTATISNDDSATLQFTSASLATNEASGPLNFMVELTNPVDVDVMIDFDSSDGSATTVDSDYAAANGTLTFTAGQTGPLSAPVTLHDDNTVELDETLTMALSNLVNQDRNITLGLSNASGQITNDDTATLSIANITMDEGDASSTTIFSFEVSSDNLVDTNVSLDFATRDDTATTADNDYQAYSGSLTIPAGSTASQMIDVTVHGDDVAEATERFFVDLSNLQNGGRDVTLTSATGIGTIVADDTAIFISDATVVEGDSGQTVLEFTVTAEQVPAGPAIEVIANTADGTATVADGDYVAVQNLSLMFDDQNPTQTVSVLVNGDDGVELNESFTVDLTTNATNIMIVNGSALGTIENDDAATVSIDSASVVEGNSGSTSTLTFTVMLDNVVDHDVNVDFATNDGTALVSNNDYAANSGMAIIPAGSTSQHVTVTVNGDDDAEADETLSVQLSNLQHGGRHVSIDNHTGTGTIENDDIVGIVVDDVAITEGDSGTLIANVTVSLTGEVSETVTVDFATADGSAQVADQDYFMNTGTVTFAPGSTSETLSITIQGDDKFESDETLTVMLSNANAGSADVTIQDSEATLTIHDDDDRPTVSINSVSVHEPEFGTATATFTVSLSNPSSETVTLDFTTEDISAEDENGSGDYQSHSGTLTFVDDLATSLEQTITIEVNADDTEETPETFRVVLSNAQGTTLDVGADDGIGTILSDLGTASLSGRVTLPFGNDVIGIPHVLVTIQGNNLDTAQSVLTDSTGHYSFTDLMADRYWISQGDISTLFIDGPDQIGTQGGETANDQFFNIDIEPGEVGTANEFTESGLRPTLLSKRLLLNSTPPPAQFLADLLGGGSTTNGNGVVPGPVSSISAIVDPQVVVQQDTVTIIGSDGYDEFEIEVSVSELSITVNDQAQSFSLDDVSQVNLQGGGGGDTVNLLGGPSDEVAQLSPGTATLQDSGENYLVNLSGIDQISMDGGGGFNTADVFDSIGNDSLQIQPSIAHLSGEQLANQVVNFDLVRAVSRSGGTDTVTGSSLADYVLQLNGNWLGS